MSFQIVSMIMKKMKEVDNENDDEVVEDVGDEEQDDEDVDEVANDDEGEMATDEDCADERDNDDEDDDDNGIEKEKRKHRTKRQKKKDKNEITKQKYAAAIAAFKSGDHKSVNACAKAYGVNQSSLASYLKSGKCFVGGGKQSIVFTIAEEKRIIQFVTDRVNLGVGLDFSQLSSVIQELLLELRKVDKEIYSSNLGEMLS